MLHFVIECLDSIKSFELKFLVMIDEFCQDRRTFLKELWVDFIFAGCSWILETAAAYSCYNGANKCLGGAVTITEFILKIEMKSFEECCFVIVRCRFCLITSILSKMTSFSFFWDWRILNSFFSQDSLEIETICIRSYPLDVLFKEIN